MTTLAIATAINRMLTDFTIIDKNKITITINTLRKFIRLTVKPKLPLHSTTHTIMSDSEISDLP